MASAALNKFSAGRLKAATTWPYAAPAILATSVVEKPGCGGITADKFWRLYFDPAVIDTLSMQQIVGKILFEVSHLLRAHYKRFAKQVGFDPSKMKPRPEGIEQKRKAWSVAAKLEIIDDFDGENLQLPDGMPRAADFEFPTQLLSEHYYARLQRAEDGNSGGSSGQSQQSQQQSQSSPGKGKGRGKPQQQKSPSHQEESPPDGSACDGCPRDWEEPAPASGDGYEDDPNDPVSDIPGLDENEADMVRREVAKRTNEHSKSRGNVPAGMRRWAKDVEQPRLDYRRIVLQKVNRAVQIVRGNKDFSYKRPSRRNPSNTVISPSLIDHTMKLAVVVDTSGSMSDRQLGEAIKIIAGVLKALPRRDAVRVMACDAAVYKVQQVFNESRVELEGGGGTDMTLAIEQASDMKPRPDLCLVLTDGYTPWPAEPKNGVPVVAIIVSEGSKSAPAWISQVCVPYVTDTSDEEAEAA